MKKIRDEDLALELSNFQIVQSLTLFLHDIDKHSLPLSADSALKNRCPAAP